MELVVTTTRRPGAPERRRAASSVMAALAALGGATLSIEAPARRSGWRVPGARATSAYADCSDLRYSPSVFVIFAFLHRGVEVDQDARVP